MVLDNKNGKKQKTILLNLMSFFRFERIYQSKKLIQDIQSSGMIHWATHHAHSLHAPFWWLKCLLGPQREKLWPVALYHRFLTWDLMEKPRMTRLLETLLDPIMGKSVVLYFRKKPHSTVS